MNMIFDLLKIIDKIMIFKIFKSVSLVSLFQYLYWLELVILRFLPPPEKYDLTQPINSNT